MSDFEKEFIRLDAFVQAGRFSRAVQVLKEVLGQDPDNLFAHYMLAICLINLNRLHGACFEAEMAIRIAPLAYEGHYAAAHAYMLKGDFKRALNHAKYLLELMPHSPEPHHIFAQICKLKHDRAGEEKHLIKALELDPDNADIQADLGDVYLATGRIQKATEKAREVLDADPEHSAGLVLMGKIFLNIGEVEKAREHAVWALHKKATDHGALLLMASIKARENLFLGLWWRFNTKVMQLGTSKAILLLLGVFALYKTLTIFADTNSLPWGDYLNFAWLALCVYSWVSPGIFQRSIDTELGRVELQDDF